MKKNIIVKTQKKKEIEFTLTQKEIIESLEKCEKASIILSVTSNRTPGTHTIKLEHNGSGFIRSLFKNKK